MSIFSRRKKYAAAAVDMATEIFAIKERLEALEKNIGHRRYMTGYAHFVLDMDGNMLLSPSINDELEVIRRHLGIHIKMNPDADKKWIAEKVAKEGKK